MRRLLILIALLTPPALGQGVLEMKVDLRPGEVYRYRLDIEGAVAMAGVPERLFRVAVDSAYEVLAVDRSGFTLLFHLDRVGLDETGLDGSPAEVPAALEALLGRVGRLEVAYDRSWNVREVGGLGRLLGEAIEGEGDPLEALGDGIVRAIESVVGPAVGSVLSRSAGDGSPGDAGALFARGRLEPGVDESGEDGDDLLGRTARRFRILALERHCGRPAVRTAYERRLDYGGLFRILGYETRTETEESVVLASGLPVRVARTIDFGTSPRVGLRLVVRTDLRLVEIGRGR